MERTELKSQIFNQRNLEILGPYGETLRFHVFYFTQN